MTDINEIAPDTYRISTYVENFDLMFNQYLVVDEEPLLFHTGMRSQLHGIKEAIAAVMDPARLRWISFSHFEADECGALNEWLAVAPRAQPACSVVAKAVSVDDFSARPARALEDDERFTIGRHRLRFLQTPHVPHSWEAGLLYDETTRTLFCSDLGQHTGKHPPVTNASVVERMRQTLVTYETGPLAQSIPYTPRTDGTLRRLARLEPRLLACMHGSAFSGNASVELVAMSPMLREVLAPEHGS